MRNILLVFLLTFCLTEINYSFSQQNNFNTWNELLSKNVNKDGIVNYKNLKKESAKLDEIIQNIKKNSPENSWSNNEKKAFWINAYNVFTVKLILDKYPLKSIKDLSFGGKSAWDYKWIEIGESKLSLNDIENTKLRKAFNDPRIHFLINCASFSCPIILNKAITSENVESLLIQQTKSFLNDKKRNKISEEKAEISELFSWYKEDFGDIIKFINKYSTVKLNEKANISYLPYNWNLNE